MFVFGETATNKYTKGSYCDVDLNDVIRPVWPQSNLNKMGFRWLTGRLYIKNFKYSILLPYKQSNFTLSVMYVFKFKAHVHKINQRINWGLVQQ